MVKVREFGLMILPSTPIQVTLLMVDTEKTAWMRLRSNEYTDVAFMYYILEDIPHAVRYYIDGKRLFQSNLWDIYERCDEQVFVSRSKK